MKKALTIFLPRIQDILFVLTLSGAFLLGSRMLSIDSDLGRHLALGRYILKTGTVPTRDLFSHTLPGAERPPYEWLTQVLFTLADRLAGLDGVVLLVCLVIALVFSFVYKQAVRRSGLPVISLFLTILAMAASSLHWLPRPHVVTFLLLALLLERLETLWRGELVPLWQFPALMLVWANMHGGFVFGFLVWLAYIAGWGWESWIKKNIQSAWTGRQLLVGFLMAGIASIVTPGGWGNWEAVLSNNSPYILRQTVETMPPNIRQPNTWPFFLLVLLSICLLFAVWKRAHTRHIFLLTGLGGMGILMARNIPLFAVAAVPVLSIWVREMLQDWTTARLWLKFENRFEELQKTLHSNLWPVLFVLGFVFLIGSRQVFQEEPLMHFDRRLFPVRAVDWLEANPPSGQMFNEFNWGGYLLYRLWPEQKVFLDSQTDFYGEALVREYEQTITASPGWENILNRYNVSLIIISPTTNLASTLQNSPNWELLYQDQTTVILRKTVR